MSEKFYGHPRFYSLLEELKTLHSNKNHDYSGETDPLRNLKQCQDAGVEPWVGVIVRLTDKMDRAKSYAKKREFKVGSEGLIDTFKDMATYALLGIILFEEAERERVQLSNVSGGTPSTNSSLRISVTNGGGTEADTPGDYRPDPDLPRIPDDEAED